MLCNAGGCRLAGQHLRCVDPDCRGCLPRYAADGLRLCWFHRDQIGLDAVRAAENWVELEAQLDGSSSGSGPVVSGTRERGLKVNEAVVRARADIEVKLASWSALICDERGWKRPKREPHKLAAFIATSATWLAAHDLAPMAVEELREVAWGLPQRLAYPDGSRVHVISTGCPADGCDGQARAYLRAPGSLLPAGEIRCDVEKSHRWASHEWLGLVKR